MHRLARQNQAIVAVGELNTKPSRFPLTFTSPPVISVFFFPGKETLSCHWRTPGLYSATPASHLRSYCPSSPFQWEELASFQPDITTQASQACPGICSCKLSARLCKNPRVRSSGFSRALSADRTREVVPFRAPRASHLCRCGRAFASCWVCLQHVRKCPFSPALQRGGIEPSHVCQGPEEAEESRVTAEWVSAAVTEWSTSRRR